MYVIYSYAYKTFTKRKAVKTNQLLVSLLYSCLREREEAASAWPRMASNEASTVAGFALLRASRVE